MKSFPAMRRWWLIVLALTTTLGMGLGAGYEAGGATGTPPTPAGSQARVDINSADARVLETLPGVGPVLAERIIAGRPYRTIADLERVKGLGKSKVLALGDKVVFGPISPQAKFTGPGTGQLATTKGSSSGKATNSSAVLPGGTTKNRQTVTTKYTTNASPVIAAQPKLAPGEKINLNKASQQDLERLPGIGPAKAKAIVDYRAQHGDFKTIDGIQQVSGIKQGVFSRIKNCVTVE